MNILHISRTMGQGGAEKIVYQLAESMKDRCGTVCVASTGGCYVKRLIADGIAHYRIDDIEHKSPHTILRTLFRLHWIIVHEKIDIIHSHHRMAAIYARILKVVHPGLHLVYTAHNVFFDKKRLTKATLQDTSIAAVGLGVRENLIDFFHIRPEQITVIYNAIQAATPDTEYRNETMDEWKAQGFELLGFIGRLSEQKGVDIFLKVIAALKRDGRQIRGIIVGDGELMGKMLQEADALGIQEEVLFLGYQECVSTLISQMDLILMPSRWEGLPLLPLEVFAEKKTLVGSDISGINEIVSNGENGSLVRKDNIHRFVEATELLLDNQERRRAFGENGFDFYMRTFSYKKFREQYYRLYQEVMEKREK